MFKTWQKVINKGSKKEEQIGVDVYSLLPTECCPRTNAVCNYYNFPHSSGMASGSWSCTLQEFVDGKLNDSVIKDLGKDVFNEILEYVNNLLKKVKND